MRILTTQYQSYVEGQSSTCSVTKSFDTPLLHQREREPKVRKQPVVSPSLLLFGCSVNNFIVVEQKT